MDDSVWTFSIFPRCSTSSSRLQPRHRLRFRWPHRDHGRRRNDWNFVANNVPEYIDPFYSATILRMEALGRRSSGQVVVAPPEGLCQGELGSEVYNWLRRCASSTTRPGGCWRLRAHHEHGRRGKTWYRRIG